MPPTAKAVLISLADNANDHGICWPAISTISKRTCFSERAVINAIKTLEEMGILVADRSNGRHTSYAIKIDFHTKPLHEVHRCSKITGAGNAPKPLHLRHDHCTSFTQPLHEVHTNRKEPSLEPSIEPIVSSKLPTCPHAEILKLYSQTLPGLIQPKIWDATREQLLKSRWQFLLTNKKTNGDPYATDKDSAIRWLTGFFEYIGKSDFLMGNVETDRPFKADLVWILKPANFAKIIEGKYHTRNGS
jgi:hypothetical protein